jgi:uncharacterized glyoxalase superfamily protein PhnB
MNATPNGWPRLTPALFYDNAATAIDWLCRAFGFEARLKVEGDNGRIEHSELVYGEGVIMVGQAGANPRRPGLTFPTSPKSVGGANTQTLMLYVDDVEAHCSHARAAGATIFMEPEVHDYGPDYWSDRSYGAVDPEGHHWWFTQRLRDPQR